MREINGRGVLVPDEAPPLDRDQRECWPPGWGPGRLVRSEYYIYYIWIQIMNKNKSQNLYVLSINVGYEIKLKIDLD